MAEFRPGDEVSHDDGRIGVVIRVTGSRVTVQFPNQWRASVVFAKRLLLENRPEAVRDVV